MNTQKSPRDFDALVKLLETSLLPVVRQDEEWLHASGHFSDVEVLSLRHAETVHALGIACRPVWASDELERLTFTAALIEFERLSGRIDVQWSQVFNTRTGSGYTKRECGGFHGPLMTDADITRFKGEWFRLAGLFRRVARRGKPSTYLLRRLRGAPADQYGWKQDAMST
ncbi:hypothetical protein [Opitutus sp. ER46]|uniref:hypothetical protein n=1 Tax=Opitutus sp. ER46 TaxID=2161864 RepID=UPI0011B2486A|nr:hypothetical protein [Opitutus sp. ER46]